MGTIASADRYTDALAVAPITVPIFDTISPQVCGCFSLSLSLTHSWQGVDCFALPKLISHCCVQ